MLLFFFFNILAICFLACPASAGSRRWEMPLHQIRGNATLLAKRSVTVTPGSAAGDTRIWPEKTITYAFADSTANHRLKALFVQGGEVWARLKHYDFQYKEISTSKCKADRLNCLMIHYNTKGVLSSTVAKPPLRSDDPKYEGPVMHLSDSFAVGNRDPIMNVAHEIGHAWGMSHEHQNYKFWKTNDEHKNPESGWQNYDGDIFHTNKFNCKNLRDYQDVLEKLPQDDFDFELTRICSSQAAAKRYGFSAMEWLPMGLVGLKPLPKYDPDSIMLYPSRAGGSGDASETTDNRLIVMSYADNTEIPVRQGPSDWDINSLVTLYGAENRAASEPYVKKGSSKENVFRRMRGESTRAGHTEGGLC
jgi:hypothetical protein